MLSKGKKAPGIGLEIGHDAIRMARVKHTGGKLKVLEYGTIPTPAGAADGGIVNDPVALGESLAGLVKQLNLKGRKVVSAVSGPQVYIRNIILPRMKLNELKEAALFEATTFLPIPVDEAAIDIFPLRHMEDEEGKKTELFFVAVRRQQVENLRLACEVAGLQLVAVELDPLALYRIMGEPGEAQTLLHIGAARSYFCAVKNGALLFQRYFSSGTRALCNALDPDAEPTGVLRQLDLEDGSGSDFLTPDLISETSRSLEYFHMQFKEEKQGELILCGSGARIKGLDKILSSALDMEVLVKDPLSRLILPSNVMVSDEEELKFDYLIALGLAAREVV
ncbi:MAG TPA: type IV pilus assembly protein PilM [Syntrophomonadaceae bacterium]|nr:type IV pilus assembly protein PilM [Syntrophomonadaceae bacterium]